MQCNSPYFFNVFYLLIYFHYCFLILHFYLQYFFSLHHVACGILVPWPGMEPAPLAVKVQSLNHWTTRQFPSLVFMKTHVILLSLLSYILGFCKNFCGHPSMLLMYRFKWSFDLFQTQGSFWITFFWDWKMLAWSPGSTPVCSFWISWWYHPQGNTLSLALFHLKKVYGIIE